MDGGVDSGDDGEGGGGGGAALLLRPVLGPDGVVDIDAVKRRMRATLAVLEDFSSRRAAGRSRGEYMEQVCNVGVCLVCMLCVWGVGAA